MSTEITPEHRAAHCGDKDCKYCRAVYEHGRKVGFNEAVLEHDGPAGAIAAIETLGHSGYLNRFWAENQSAFHIKAVRVAFSKRRHELELAEAVFQARQRGYFEGVADGEDPTRPRRTRASQDW